MTVCQFFLQNRCKFGDRCRFEHPRGGTQRNLFNGPSQPWQGGSGGNAWQGSGSGGVSNNWQGGGGSGGNTWQGSGGSGGNTWQGSGGSGGNTWQGGGGSGGNTWQSGGSGQRVTFKDSFGTSGQASGGQYKWTASQQSSQGSQGSDNSQQSSTLDLINSLPKEMDIWDKSHMWPFSCFAMDKDMPSLPEFYDICPEELRFEAYQAMKSGNILPYTQKVQSLQNEFQAKRRQLQHMTMDLKSKLMAVIDDDRKKKQTQPASASSSVFASSQTSQSVFGQAQASPSAALFGRSTAAAADSNSSNLFGKSTSGSVFGGNFSPRSDNSSSFGNPGASLFGKPVTAGSVFGNQPQGQAAQTPNPFGHVADNSTPKTSGLFGQTASSGPPTNTLFGNSAVNQSTSLFGGSAPGQSQGLFGKSFPQQTANASFPVGTSTPAAQTTSLFGTPLNQNQPPASLFGKPNPDNASASLFGKPNPDSTPTSLFGKPNPDNTSAIPSIFGGVASTQGSRDVSVPGHNSVFGGATSGSTASHGHYTPLADLTDQEKEAFSAKMFTLGKIPLRPPPREMVN